MVIHFRVRHNAPSLERELLTTSSRLDGAMRDGTRDGLLYLQHQVIQAVQRRTTMNEATATRITETDFRATPSGGRGVVSFRPPPPGGWKITAKGKALAFLWPKMGAGPGRGGKWLFKSVQHPGSRPYKIIPETAVASEEAIRGLYSQAVRRVL